jgi:conjugal transfer pilus assembly protein TraV
MQPCRQILLSLPLFALSGCAAFGSMMSPYSEKFSCKNSDHGQCIHPEKAWADAVAGRPQIRSGSHQRPQASAPDQTAMAVALQPRSRCRTSQNLSGKPEARTGRDHAGKALTR